MVLQSWTAEIGSRAWSRTVSSAVEQRERRVQADYYTSTAAHYDSMHLGCDDEHSLALRYVSAFMREFELRSLLDVGTGTGRAMVALSSTNPGVLLAGIEPVSSLVTRARAKLEGQGVVQLASASGYRLPFRDAAFDSVCQFGVLHHVRHPDQVIREMMRVARYAIFLSDSNRFGQGPFGVRVLKLVLARIGLWPVANYVKTHGTGYTLSAGDGLSYSYSVFDSLPALQTWADRIVLVPTGTPRSSGWCMPLLTSSHVLLCAFRDR